MPLTEHPSDQPINIQSFSPGKLVINEQTYTNNVLITADFKISPWEVSSIESLSRATLEPLLQGNPELVIIGTGDTTVFLPPALMIVFYEKGIGVEVMTSAAAVRTYTILTSEDRHVSMGLLNAPK